MRNIIAILLLAICYGELEAQRLIVRSGLNLSTVNVDFEHTLVKYGALVGIGYEYTISKHFLLQSDLSFIQKGYKHKHEYFNDLAYGFYRRTLEVNYMEIPLVIKYEFNTGNIAYRVLFGPSIGFAIGGNFEKYIIDSHRFPPDLNKIHQTVSLRFDDWPYPGDGEGNGYEVIENRFDFNLQFGGQVEFFRMIILDLRCGLGLNGFYSLRYDETLPNGRISNTKHRGIQISVAAPLSRKEGK